jgi:hypothetical protein
MTDKVYNLFSLFSQYFSNVILFYFIFDLFFLLKINQPLRRR